ncbi:MAG: hypothetical protein U9Q62_06160 [Campylobacterota bacterium]|nr:hypothetical protein [Campylobacterota bacterium]
MQYFSAIAASVGLWALLISRSNNNGPKFCSYKISQDIMDNPEAIAKIAEDAKAAG